MTKLRVGHVLMMLIACEDLRRMFLIDSALQSKVSSDYIVRITADDPLLDPGIIDKVIEEAVSDLNIDYCSNIIKSWPRGLDCEVVKSNILLDINTFVTGEDREHVTIYIRTNQKST